MTGKPRAMLAHLVDDHSKRVAARFAGRLAVLTEQESKAHPTNCPRGGNGGRRQGCCAKVNRDCHKAKICEADGAIVVNENVRLLSG